MLLDESGEQEQALGRIDSRRDRLLVTERLQRTADPLVQLRIAHRHEPREKQPAIRTANERVGDRSCGAVVGNEDQPLGKSGLLPAEARDQAGSECVGKRPVRRDGVDIGADA
jgi:hypothetical protein